MTIIITFLLLAALVAVFYQDFKYRSIHVILPLVIGALSISAAWKSLYVNAVVIVTNILFIGLTVGIMVAYMSLKRRQLLNPFQTYFGLGDLFILLAICPLFLIRNFALFFIAAMLFSLLMHLYLLRFIKEQSVPLAGYVSLFLAGIIIFDFFSSSALTFINI